MKRLQPGELLDGRYSIVETLAQGGFGQTYIAEDRRRPGNPQCVVKQLQPENRHPRLLETAERLFFTEAETLERLGNHTQIPRLLAYFQEDDEFYLIQEFINGQTLTNELKLGEVWPEGKIYQLLQSVLQVLAFIHQNSVIHRDIKPDNIIRRYTDQALVLVDFGTVKQVRSQLTSQGQIAPTVAIGTPGYMPTEQSRGNPRHNSDIYALGMVGIQAATGLGLAQLQEDLETGEIIWQPWAKVDPTLGAILSKMVRYHFKDRYQSAVDVLQDLEQNGAITSFNVSTLEEISPGTGTGSNQSATTPPPETPTPQPVSPPVPTPRQVPSPRQLPTPPQAAQGFVAQSPQAGSQNTQLQKGSSIPKATDSPKNYATPEAPKESDPTLVVSPGQPSNGNQPTAAQPKGTIVPPVKGPPAAVPPVVAPSASGDAPQASRNLRAQKAGATGAGQRGLDQSELSQPLQLAALFGSGSWLLAAGLLSFLGTILATGFWLAIIAVLALVIFARKNNFQDQLLLTAIAVISTGCSLLLIPNNIGMGALLSSGLWGWLSILIIALFAGAFTFALLLLAKSMATS